MLLSHAGPWRVYKGICIYIYSSPWLIQGYTSEALHEDHIYLKEPILRQTHATKIMEGYSYYLQVRFLWGHECEGPNDARTRGTVVIDNVAHHLIRSAEFFASLAQSQNSEAACQNCSSNDLLYSKTSNIAQSHKCVAPKKDRTDSF